ncbi:vasodilator-stimulated phosphoprotein-like [Canis lupus familiaris]|uniref:vasodilator-stimulated phosphoprotein-like n=1 Tax=Canis lupus familiaris TaxID=9615 RepID=UPI0018F7C0ED|nr:vasodilator-stimulated phosphoprotein-like [Canis lupus familiaris]XP_038413367.1 vasodilator-stimulated phosphoprotein-like [Canis lupus familiaris]XP_038413368.1 vasodilator-stimulated phosphoprotein-like [Canis lupus familiaris]
MCAPAGRRAAVRRRQRFSSAWASPKACGPGPPRGLPEPTCEPPSGRPSAPPARTVEVLGSKTIAPILPGFRTVEGRGGGGPCVTCVTLRGPPGSARMRGFEVRGCERKEQPNSRGAVAPQQTSTLPQELRVCSFCNAFRL